MFRHATLSTALFQHRNSRDRDCHFERTFRGLLTVFHLVNAAHPREAAVRGVRLAPEKKHDLYQSVPTGVTQQYENDAR